MSNAKAKAKELVDNYVDLQSNINWTDNDELLKTCETNYSFYGNEMDIYWNLLAKQCALIAVDEILKVAFFADDKIYNFYLEVKQEIEKL